MRPNQDILHDLVGHENISEILINGVRTKSLVDTGSQISTISEGYLKHLNPVPEIRTLDELELDVKCADGQSLQYKGLHKWHMQRHNFFRSPPPWALGRGKKVKYH